MDARMPENVNTLWHSQYNSSYFPWLNDLNTPLEKNHFNSFWTAYGTTRDRKSLMYYLQSPVWCIIYSRQFGVLFTVGNVFVEIHYFCRPVVIRRECHNSLVSCFMSQQQASVSQGRICSDNFTCCHTETEVADPTFHLTQSHYADTGPTSPSMTL